jgi:hypothetical protein
MLKLLSSVDWHRISMSLSRSRRRWPVLLELENGVASASACVFAVLEDRPNTLYLLHWETDQIRCICCIG